MEKGLVKLYYESTEGDFIIPVKAVLPNGRELVRLDSPKRNGQVINLAPIAKYKGNYYVLFVNGYIYDFGFINDVVTNKAGRVEIKTSKRSKLSFDDITIINELLGEDGVIVESKDTVDQD